MKERPILFSGPMVRALLAGTKTQTRRICKPAKTLSAVVEVPDPMERGQVYNGSHFGDEEGAVQFPCPYGGIRDRLWVRETFARIDGQTRPWIETDYKATYTHGDRLGDRLGITKKWSPSIHMPRHASRITLEIAAVRVERLQDISEADARAEGARECDPVSGREVLLAGPSQRGSFILHYRDIWEQINGPGSWAANPWVWVLEFRRLQEGGAA